MNAATDQPNCDQLVIAGGDSALDSQLSAALDTYNFAASGASDQREFTVKVEDDAGHLMAGLSGWTWGPAPALRWSGFVRTVEKLVGAD